MRLTPEQASCIHLAAQDVFRLGTEVWLFGSRVDASKKGGDIDLLFRPQQHDLDIAVATDKPLTVEQKMKMISELAELTGRPIDLIDLHEVTEPLLGQIVQHGRRVLGSDTSYGKLISRHLFEQADFMPYQARILAERRMAWIGK